MKHLLRFVPLIAILSIMALLLSLPQVTRAVPTTPTIASSPVSQTWYFAEGRVGGGFLTWLTIGNPNAVDCTVTIRYDYIVDRTTTDISKQVTFPVIHASRHTQYVNNDLNILQNDVNGANLSAVVTASDCSGITAERPMYYTNHLGVSSGTDVFGATAPQTTWYFAEVPRGSAGESFLSVLNPNSTNATVTVSYYVGGTTPIAETQIVNANSRGTFDPNNTAQLLSAQHMAVKVTSNVPIVVERPAYFVNVHNVSGSADVLAETTPFPTWVLAAGTTQPGSQENIIVSNVSNASINATIQLFAVGGAVGLVVPISIPANSQFFFDVNANNVFTGHTADVSAIITTANPAGVLVQRQIFGTYTGSTGWTAQGVSDAFGVDGTAETYNFAEGFTSVNFNEWLMLANPDPSRDITVTITLVNMLGQTDSQTIPVPAHSRVSFDVTHMVANSAVFSLNNVKAYAVSMSTSSTDGPFAAERIMWWSAFGTQGTSAVPGFAAGATSVTPTPTATLSPTATAIVSPTATPIITPSPTPVPTIAI